MNSRSGRNPLEKFKEVNQDIAGRDAGGTVPLDSVRNPGETVEAWNETTRADSDISADTVRDDTRASDREGYSRFTESSAGVHGKFRDGDRGEKFGSSEGYEGDYQTGWESERGIYFEYVMGGKAKNQRPSESERRTATANDKNRFPDGNSIGDTLAGGLHSLASFAESVENDNDDEEERKKKNKQEMQVQDSAWYLEQQQELYPRL